MIGWLTPGRALCWSGWCLAMAMVLPVAKVGVDWPAGWQVAVMAALGAPSLFIAPGDMYVLACAATTAANLLFLITWIAGLIAALRRRRGRGRWRFWAGCVSAGLLAFALLPLFDAGLLGGVHVGLLFYLAAPMVLALAHRRPSVTLTDAPNPDDRDPTVETP